MPAYSSASLSKLSSCAEPLIRLMLTVVKGFDNTILEGARSLEQQRKNVEKGVSKTLDSKHLARPKALAVDAAPYPLKWPDRASPTYVKDLARFYFFGGYVLGVASQLGIKVRFGGDWDGDRDIHDQDFDDLVHFELEEAP